MAGGRAGIASALLSLTIVATSTTVAYADSTTFQVNPAHTGYSPHRLDGLQKAWTAFHGEYPAYPLITGGRVFVLTDSLQALDETTGRPLWRVELPKYGLNGLGFSASGPAYGDGKVFVAQRGLDDDGSTTISFVDAYDAATGQLVWRTQQLRQSGTDAPLVAADGVLYFASASSGITLYALSQATGAQLWERTLFSGNDSSPAVGPDRVYLNHACDSTAIDRDDGAVAWTFAKGCASGGGGSTAVYADGRVFATDELNFTGRIFDAASGALAGSFAMGDTRDPPPAVVGDTGVFLQGGRLTARHLSDGAPLWSFDGDGTLKSAPVIAGDRVYVGGESGAVYGLDLATGVERWRGDAGAPILSPKNSLTVYLQGMAVSDRSLVVNTTNGMVAFVGRPAAGAPPMRRTDESPARRTDESPARLRAWLRARLVGPGPVLRLRAGCSRRCRATVRIRVVGRDARRLTKRLGADGRRMTLRLGKRARVLAARRRGLSLRATLHARSADGARATVTSGRLHAKR